MKLMNRFLWLGLFAGLVFSSAAKEPGAASKGPPAEDIFTGGLVPHIRIEISQEGMEILRAYHQVWGQPRPERVDVKATIREGNQVYTNVTLHLKGSYSFQPIDAKPSFTINFEKSAEGQKFHGLGKLHL